MSATRARYDGVVIAAPVTIPYVRYSTKEAHWFLACALSALLKTSGLRKQDIDGLGVSASRCFPTPRSALPSI